MTKIPKGLSDTDMLKDCKEHKSTRSLFDLADEFDDNNIQKRKRVTETKATYIDGELTTALNKELLKLKIDLYKKGIIEYQVKLKRDGDNIILYPQQKKHKN